MRCSLKIFFVSAAGRPRRSNDELYWKETASLFQIAGMTRLVYWLFQINELCFMLSFRAVFITEFCFGRLPQIAAIRKIAQLLLIISSISQPGLFCFGFDLNQWQIKKICTKPIFRNDYGPDCQVSANRPPNNWAKLGGKIGIQCTKPSRETAPARCSMCLNDR